MTDKQPVAYARISSKHTVYAELCPLRLPDEEVIPLPPEAAQFGVFDSESGALTVRLEKKDITKLHVASDWFREQGWVVYPEGTFTDDDARHWTTKTLIERGWTKGLIATWLPEPDTEVKNPHYATASLMKLYARGRVLALEKFHVGHLLKSRTKKE